MKLAGDRTMREFLVSQASGEVRTGSLTGQAQDANSAREQQLQEGLKRLTAAGVFPGPEWSRWCAPAHVQPSTCYPREWDWLIILGSLGGCFITACAVSLGAPFWFDILNKFVVIRSTVKPKEKSPDEKSKS
jgi:hypothetical protein